MMLTIRDQELRILQIASSLDRISAPGLIISTFTIWAKTQTSPPSNPLELFLQFLIQKLAEDITAKQKESVTDPYKKMYSVLGFNLGHKMVVSTENNQITVICKDLPFTLAVLHQFKEGSKLVSWWIEFLETKNTNNS